MELQASQERSSMNLEDKNRPMDVTPTLGSLELGGMCFQPVETIIDVSDFQEHRYGYKCIDLFFYSPHPGLHASVRAGLCSRGE